MKWDEIAVDFITQSVPLMSDQQIADELTLITGEAVSLAAVKIQRGRLGLYRDHDRRSGRRWGTAWNPKNTM